MGRESLRWRGRGKRNHYNSILEPMARYEGEEQGGVALKCELDEHRHMDTKHVHRRWCCPMVRWGRIWPPAPAHEPRRFSWWVPPCQHWTPGPWPRPCSSRSCLTLNETLSEGKSLNVTGAQIRGSKVLWFYSGLLEHRMVFGSRCPLPWRTRWTLACTLFIIPSP